VTWSRSGASTTDRNRRAGGEPFFLGGFELSYGGFVELRRPVAICRTPCVNGVPRDLESFKRLIYSISGGSLRAVILLPIYNHHYFLPITLPNEKPVVKSLPNGSCLRFGHFEKNERQGALRMGTLTQHLPFLVKI
jgi:hypothetical protein